MLVDHYEEYNRTSETFGIFMLTGAFVLMCFCLNDALKHIETPDTLHVYNGVDRAEIVARWNN